MKCGHCGEYIFAKFERWMTAPDGAIIHEFDTRDGRLECSPHRERASEKLAEVVEFLQRDQKSA